MEILDYTAIKSLGITAKACERYGVPQVRTTQGIKLAAIFSESCFKVLNLDGSFFWSGSDYDPNFGIFGQKAVTPGKPVVVVPTELEALKLGSVGIDAVCLAEPRQTDSLCLGILADNLQAVTKDLWIWGESTFGKRAKAMEKFLLYLAGTKKFTISLIDGSNTPILAMSGEDIKAVVQSSILLREWKPRGISFTGEIMEASSFLQPVTGVSTGYACIDASNKGIRKGEITMLTAGSGVGKSTLAREIAYSMGVKSHQKCGMIFLEEKAERTVKSLAAIKYNTPVDKLREKPDLLTEKQWEDFRNNKAIRNNFVFMAHFGSLDSDELFSKIDYMIDFCGCDFIFLDHISILVSGMSSKEGERKDIDILMTRLATLAVSKDVGFICISHLSQPEGAPHEEGGRVTLSQLRGSGSIKQLSASIFALERNQQDPNSTLALLRQLKARETGKTGPIGVLNYDFNTGRLKEDTTWNPLEFEQLLTPKKRNNWRDGGKPPGGGGSSFGNNKFVDAY